VDDLLLCGLLEDNTSWATESLLNFLAGQGYILTREKAQFCQTQVNYLGLVLTKGMRVSGNDKIHPILAFPLF
jgi:hypothetical protein